MHTNGMLDIRRALFFEGLTREEESLACLFLLFRLLQQSNQFLFRNPATGLTIVESALMLEIDGRAPISAYELTNLFSVDQSTMSRNLSKLQKKGLIKQSASPLDGRQKIISTAHKGSKIMEKHDDLSNRIVTTYLAGLEQGQAAKIVEFFKRFSNDFKISEGVVRRGEHPIRAEMRRLAFLLGVTRNENFVSSELSMLSWHVLSEIFLQGEVPLDSFANQLKIPKSSLLQLISRFEAAHYISKRAGEHDGRTLHVSCTEVGTEALRVVLRNGVDFFKTNLTVDTKKQIDPCLPLVQKLIGKDCVGDNFLGAESTFGPIKGAKRLAQARAFLVTKAVEQNQVDLLHYEIASPHNLVMGLFHNNCLCGVSEYRDGILLHEAYDPKGMKFRVEFVQNTLESQFF